MAEVVVAGHLCLDIIPKLSSPITLRPGTLTEIGAAAFAAGGGVSNVGSSLLKLGVRTKLVGRIGRDAFGEALRALLTAHALDAADTLQTGDESTSYTLVISPPGTDRAFLHYPGANDAFAPADVDLGVLGGARIFYFGYPPVMKRFYEDGGDSLAALLKSVKALGVTTALDMTLPDPDAASGRVDWRDFLTRVLPFVDVFLPSLDETLFMLEPSRFGSTLEPMPAPFLTDLAERVLGLSAGVVGFKLGKDGLYLKTADEARLSDLGRATPPALTGWANRELWSPVFETTVEGTVGAGDATFAGFLAAMLRGSGLEEAASMANAVGASSVEAADATSGVRSWAETAARVESWPPRAPPNARRLAAGNAWYLPWAAGRLELKKRSAMEPIILPTLPAPLEWLGKPTDWQVEGERLTLTAGRETDLFRDPGGAPARANAPALLFPTDGDLCPECKGKG